MESAAYHDAADEAQAAFAEAFTACCRASLPGIQDMSERDPAARVGRAAGLMACLAMVAYPEREELIWTTAGGVAVEVAGAANDLPADDLRHVEDLGAHQLGTEAKGRLVKAGCAMFFDTMARQWFIKGVCSFAMGARNQAPRPEAAAWSSSERKRASAAALSALREDKADARRNRKRMEDFAAADRAPGSLLADAATRREAFGQEAEAEAPRARELDVARDMLHLLAAAGLGERGAAWRAEAAACFSAIDSAWGLACASRARAESERAASQASAHGRLIWANRPLSPRLLWAIPLAVAVKRALLGAAPALESAPELAPMFERAARLIDPELSRDQARAMWVALAEHWPGELPLPAESSAEIARAPALVAALRADPGAAPIEHRFATLELAALAALGLMERGVAERELSAPERRMLLLACARLKEGLAGALAEDPGAPLAADCAKLAPALAEALFDAYDPAPWMVWREEWAAACPPGWEIPSGAGLGSAAGGRPASMELLIESVGAAAAAGGWSAAEAERVGAGLRGALGSANAAIEAAALRDALRGGAARAPSKARRM